MRVSSADPRCAGGGCKWRVAVDDARLCARLRPLAQSFEPWRASTTCIASGEHSCLVQV
jgi:hypothetical protein